MKQILLHLFLLVGSVSYGQTKVTIRGNSGGVGTATAPTITASLATTLSLSTSATSEVTYVFTGSAAATWTMPAASSSSTFPIKVKNKGLANVTLTRSGADQFYITSVTNAIILFPGDAYELQKNGTVWIAL